LVRTGRWVEAAERYHQVASLPLEAGNAAVQQTAQKDSEREVSELLPRIPSVTLQLVGAAAGEVELTMDGQALDATVLDEPLLLNPGEHRAEARRGEQRSAASVSLVAGQHENIVLAFRVAPRPAEAAPFVAPMAPGPLQGERAGVDANADARHAWRTVGWVSLGLGAAGIATGVAAYFIGDARYDKLQEDPSCSKNSCGPSAEDDVEGYDPIRTVHLVGLIAGGVLTATGITLLLVTGEPEMDVALRLGPGSATLATTF
ncbi:MAG TPA: hypothetical protein VNN80_17560, partial [Polyangiaceae bacterium]|nr:hypothetical protein [Polyangiaceae bacterium]